MITLNLLKVKQATLYFKKINKKGMVKMSITKNKYSTCKVVNKKGKIVGYLCARDEERGLDIQLDKQGYTIIAL